MFAKIELHRDRVLPTELVDVIESRPAMAVNAARRCRHCRSHRGWVSREGWLNRDVG
jgi:hypothetical protein